MNQPCKSEKAAASPAKASEQEPACPICAPYLPRKPDSASTGKLYRECHSSEKGAIYLSGTNVNGYFVEVAATPSGGEEWTVEYVRSLYDEEFHFNDKLQTIADAHNACLK